jgi:transcriptional regulator with XRE-family HTH domain
MRAAIVTVMTETFGDLLRSARLELGWDQAQFARRVGLGQQTVSRWERGSSTPRRTMILQIAEVLGLDAQILLDAAADGQRDGTPGVELPVRPLLTELPLGQLPEDVFERFCSDLAEQLYPWPDVVHGYGSRGHKQDGIDIEVCHPDSLPTGIQCKRVKEFGPEDVRDAVKALTMKAHECVIYLSRVASPGARKEIAAHDGWRLLDGVDIARAVRGLPDLAKIRLVDTYFPGFREAFLGVPRPSPWETVEDFFRPLTGIALFSHKWRLVGRDQELAALAAFARDADRRVALVIGQGGIGKSRIVRQVGSDLSQPGADGVAVLFTAAGTGVQPADFEQLPPGGRLVLVIEDAHERPDVVAIVYGVLRRRPDAHVVISVRPYALAELENGLRGLGVYPEDCLQVRLDELAVPDAQSLAAEALGDTGSPVLADWLGSVSPDCPLIIVVAAELSRRGSLDLARLQGNTRIHRAIMDAFRDAMTAGADVGDPDVRREVLSAVAALQPFRLHDDDCRSAMSTLTSRPFDQVMPYLSALEAAQVLQRQGTSLRVVPDLLGDAVLAGACVHAATGVATGYLERAYKAADGTALAHLFVNCCRMDWQVSQSGTSQASLTGPLWEHVRAEFERAENDERVGLLRLLRKVAAFQPEPALDLCRWALSNPAGNPGTRESGPAARYSWSDRDVRHELAPVLENVAFNPGCLAAAADLLWQLAGTDMRKTNQVPDHPIRVLQRLIGYAPTTPLVYQENLFAVVSAWLDEPDPGDLPYSPFDVLEELLATEAVVQTSDGLSLTIRSYPVAPGAVRDLRSRVMELAFAQLKSPHIRPAVRAAEALGKSLTYPMPAYNRTPDEDERDRWTPVFIDTITKIGSAAAESGLDPAVIIALQAALLWHYQHSATETRAAARQVWRALPDSAEDKLALVVHDSWGTLMGDGDSYEYEKQQLKLDEVVSEVVSAWPEHELLDRLEQRLATEQKAFGNHPAHSSPVLWRIAEKRPLLADELCRRVTRNHDSILRDLIPPALGRLLEARPADGLARLRELLEADDLDITRNVANTLGWGRGGRTSLLDGEDQILRVLIRHEDPWVRQHTVFATRRISPAEPALARELVTTVRFADSGPLADDVAAAFSGQGHIRWQDLTDDEARHFLDQIAECPSISEYHVTLLLAEISSHDPETAVDLLIRRIETWEQTPSPLDYDPLPHIWHQQPHFTSHPQYGDLLRRVLRWLTDDPDSFRRQYAGGQLFSTIAGEYGQEALSVLRAALASGDQRQVKVVGSVLSDAPATLLWEEVDFVSHALTYAQQHGDETFQQVAAGLQAAAIPGMRYGAVRVGFENDITQRDMSAQVLSQLTPGSLTARFYQALQKTAGDSVRWKTDVDDLLTSRRDW